jgi:phytanoyl-CoA hydroxylase
MPLTDEQLEHYHREGYLVARDVIPARYILDLQEEINSVIDEQANKLYAEGEITLLHEELGFLHRAAALSQKSRKVIGPVNGGNFSGPAMFNLLTCPQILDVMEQLIGAEIIASSIYRIRPKLSDSPEGIVPWHQDSGYFHTCADEHLVPTCWVPLMNATIEAGCMEVLPRSHKQGVFRHYTANLLAPPLSVHPDHLPDIDPVPVPADIGDVVLMTNMTPHRSTDNTSGLIRWATDLRYNAPEAGDYGPGEAGFLARSARTPDRVLTDCREFNHLRKEHVPQSKVDRSWLKYDEETFADASKRVDKALPKLR